MTKEEVENEKCELLGIIQGKDTEIADLKKENTELKSIANFQTSSNMDRYFQLKRNKERLAKAKEIIKKLYSHVFQGKGFMELNDYNVQKAEAEQFLRNGCEGGCGVKGFEIRRENEEPVHLFNRNDVISAIAHALYYTSNPESGMCVPNCAYERAEKEFDDWFNDTRTKKALETLSE